VDEFVAYIRVNTLNTGMASVCWYTLCDRQVYVAGKFKDIRRKSEVFFVLGFFHSFSLLLLMKVGFFLVEKALCLKTKKKQTQKFTNGRAATVQLSIQVSGEDSLENI
jgi:hypothetical protein